jgi:hypothetical protein
MVCGFSPWSKQGCSDLNSVVYPLQRILFSMQKFTQFRDLPSEVTMVYRLDQKKTSAQGLNIVSSGQ